MSDARNDIVKSPEGKRILGFVTDGFYDRSTIALWVFEAIGRELDEARDWAENLRWQAFPQTATWSLDHWEWAYGIPNGRHLPMATRRQRILAKVIEHAPMNPERVRAAVEAYTGQPTEVVENVAPYTFRIEIDKEVGVRLEYPGMFRMVRDMKPSHLSVDYLVKLHLESTERLFFGMFATPHKRYTHGITRYPLDGRMASKVGIEQSIRLHYIHNAQPPMTRTTVRMPVGISLVSEGTSSASSERER